MYDIKNLRKLALILLVSAFSFNVAAQTDEGSIKEITEHRARKHAEMKDAAKSPLDKKDRRKFKSLNYFPIDLNYRVKATFVKNETPVLFKMKTTTTRLPDYVKYGDVYFLLDGEDYKLEVYQSQDLLKKPGFENYLFIPFTDETNGKESYDVGRYIEFTMPESDDVVVDFNQSYNPYCSYSDRFSCPIPPEANNLPIEIKAGEKKYKISLLH